MKSAAPTKAFKIGGAGYADILKQFATALSSSSCMSGLNWPSKTSGSWRSGYGTSSADGMVSGGV